MVSYHSEEYLYKMNFIQNEIVLGVLVFTIAVNLMVFVILGARKLLVSSGNIKSYWSEAKACWSNTKSFLSKANFLQQEQLNVTCVVLGNNSGAGNLRTGI